MVTNILTVDLEEWFVVENLRDVIDVEQWSELPRRLEQNTHELLSLFDDFHVRATFFVLGWVAEHYPQVIREISIAGHEIACHSYYHRKVDSLSREEFKKDTEKAINAIVKAIGNVPFGYRAPSWSISSKNLWALEVLSELGFIYDSSIFPIKHDIYGWPEGPRSSLKIDLENGKNIYELPATTFRIMGKNVPVGGGGYFRHSPYWYSKKVIEKLNQQNQPAVFYVHPWEIDPELPLLEGLTTIQKFRTYSSTAILRHKINKLLNDFTFTTIADYLKLFKKKRIGFE